MKNPSPLSYIATFMSAGAVLYGKLPETGTKMNVLFIISDDLRAELGAYQSQLALTPNLDRLAKRGVRFERAYCQYPLCAPSRASMLTGRLPTKTLVYGNREWWGADHPEWDSLPMQFKKDGYQTMRTGKIFHEGIDDTDAWVKGGEPRRWSASPSKRIGNKAKPTTAAEAKAHVESMANYDKGRASQSDRWEAVEGEAVAKLGDTLVGDRALAHLREAKESGHPFFLAVGFSKPHSPLVAPKAFFDLYDPSKIPLPPDFAPRPTVPEGFPAGSIRPNNADLFIRRDATPDEARAMIRAYLACVSYVDWNVGRVLGELEKLGLAENTIVVFWSDHGYQLGEKGKWSKAGSLWEQGTRVPLMIHDPRSKANGQSSPRVVQAVDLYPTLVELCGISEEEGVDGRSLKPLLENPQAEWNHPAYTVWNERGKGISGVAVRTERWRYAEFYGPGAGAMLTDPLNDPHELKNLAQDPQYADVVKELSALAKAYVGEQAERAD